MPLSAAPPLVDVCVCTFRRESLTATLTSLDAQTGVSGRIRVLVADNDDQPSARGRVEDGSARWPRVYLHAPARNIFSQEIVAAPWRTTGAAVLTIGMALGWATSAAGGGFLIGTVGFGGLFTAMNTNGVCHIRIDRRFSSQSRAFNSE